MTTLVPSPGRDLIEVVGIRGRGHHGVLAQERRTGQLFIVDVAVLVDTADAAATDDLDRTVDYSLLAQAAYTQIIGPPVDLIETLAQQIADACLVHAGVHAVEVAVHKPSAPIGVPADDVVLRIVRGRST